MPLRRTRKWAFVAQEASRLARLGLSEREIAKRLNVSKSTVTRWKAKGKLPRIVVSNSAPDDADEALKKRQSPAEWAKSVRDEYSLDPTDDQLVTIGETALELSLNRTVAAHVRMNAAGRFQAIVRQLALVARRAQQIPVPESDTSTPQAMPRQQHARIRRHTGDPRKGLMVVK